MFFDALRVKVRDEGVVRNKAVYLALGMAVDGRREVLGLWVEQTEGAKFWLRIVNELRNRGAADILIAVVDGLKGFPAAIHAAFPQTQVQTCIVHLLRHSLSFVSFQDRREVVAAIKPIYQAPTADAAAAALAAFEAGPWGRKIPGDHAGQAPAMGAGDAVLRVPAGSAADDLHDECNREPERQATQLGAQPRPLSERRSRDQAAVSGLA